jgi:hypothetical protein
MCLEIYGRTIKMSGPVPRKESSHDQLFFVCELCNSFVEERRRRSSEEWAAS